MLLIDTHCHLYSEEFAEDVDSIVERAEKEGVHKFYLPAIDSKTHERMILLEDKFPGKCFPMMGLHPCSVKESYKEELSIVKNWLTQKKFAAIGEIGLDFYWDKTFTTQQYEAFHTQIALAKEYQLPIV